MEKIVYYQDEDPGPVGAMKEWRKPSTGEAFIRDTSNTIWNSRGNCNLEYMGMAFKGGFTATGAITGASGFAPTDSPDFTSATIDTNAIATINDMSAARDYLLRVIDGRVKTATSKYGMSSLSLDNVCMKSGVLSFKHDAYTDSVVIGNRLVLESNNSIPAIAAQTIPLPTFGNDDIADVANCVWFVSPLYMHWDENIETYGYLRYTDSDGYLIDKETGMASKQRTFAVVLLHEIALVPDHYKVLGVPVEYIIIGIR